MAVELRREEVDLVVGLLEREIDDIRAEIRHTKNHDYKESLKQREKIVQDLLARLRS
jgi:hypothetical protein